MPFNGRAGRRRGSASQEGSSGQAAMPVTTWSWRRCRPIQPVPLASRPGSTRRSAGAPWGMPSSHWALPPVAFTCAASSVAVARMSATSTGLAVKEAA